MHNYRIGGKAKGNRVGNISFGFVVKKTWTKKMKEKSFRNKQINLEKLLAPGFRWHYYRIRKKKYNWMIWNALCIYYVILYFYLLFQFFLFISLLHEYDMFLISNSLSCGSLILQCDTFRYFHHTNKQNKQQQNFRRK